MLKIKKVLCISFAVLLFAFSLLIPFRNIKKDDLNSSSAVGVQLQIQKGYYLFNLTTDSNFYYPDFDFTINNCNISFANPNGQYVTNANKIVYTASTHTLKYQVVDYTNNVLIAEGVVLNNGNWVTTYSIQSRLIFFNENILVDADIWNFFDKCTTRQFSHNQWSIFTFNLLGLNGIGSELNFINSHNEYNKYRFYIFDTDIELGVDIFNNAICINDITGCEFNTHNGYYYLGGTFATQTLLLNNIYTLDFKNQYYFYTLANSNMPFLISYVNMKYIPISFTILNDDNVYAGFYFNDNKIYTYLDDNVVNIASFPDNSVTQFNWLYDNYNFLIVKFDDNTFNNSLRKSDIMLFIFRNFKLATSYEFSVVESKNKTLEMLKEDYTMLSLFSSMFDSMLLTFKSLLNFDFFGFNIFSILCALLTISLVFIVFKLLKGR